MRHQAAVWISVNTTESRDTSQRYGIISIISSSVKTIYKRRKIRLNSQGRGFGVYRSLTKGGGGTSLLGGLPPTRRLSRYVHRVEWREINERSRLSLVCSTPQLARRHGTWNSLSLGGLPPTRRPSAVDRVACQSSQRSYWFMLQRLKKHIMTCILSFPSVIFSEQHDSMVMSAVGGLVCSTPQLARRHGTWNSLSLGGLPPTRRPSAVERVACQSSQRSYWFMLQRLKKHIMTCILSFPSVIFSERNDSMVMSAVGGRVEGLHGAPSWMAEHYNEEENWRLWTIIG